MAFLGTGWKFRVRGSEGKRREQDVWLVTVEASKDRVVQVVGRERTLNGALGGPALGGRRRIDLSQRCSSLEQSMYSAFKKRAEISTLGDCLLKLDGGSSESRRG